MREKKGGVEFTKEKMAKEIANIYDSYITKKHPNQSWQLCVARKIFFLCGNLL